jgi:hypothetical protein
MAVHGALTAGAIYQIHPMSRDGSTASLAPQINGQDNVRKLTLVIARPHYWPNSSARQAVITVDGGAKRKDPNLQGGRY